jgi:nitrous oxidase accessory protein
LLNNATIRRKRAKKTTQISFPSLRPQFSDKLLDNSTDGDILRLAAGRYNGHFAIEQAITLSGSKSHKVIIDAQGTGNGLLVKSPNVAIENLTIVNWGSNLTDQDAAIYADQLRIQNNRLREDGKGLGGWNSAYNTISNNPTQIKYVSNKKQQWSQRKIQSRRSGTNHLVCLCAGI